MEFTKQHMMQQDYNWSTETKRDPVPNKPDRCRFDRLNGYQILNIINFFGDSVGSLTVEDGQRIENLITQQLPADLKSEVAVFNWLRGRYLYHWNG